MIHLLVVSAVLMTSRLVDGLVCLNKGIPVLSEAAEIVCKCSLGYTGTFCEQRTFADYAISRYDRTSLTNLLLCAFFLLVLPSLISYACRSIYHFFMRFKPSETEHVESSVDSQSTPPPGYYEVTLEEQPPAYDTVVTSPKLGAVHIV
uniref:EGF-like domain-containing protein n=1 Tax=Steinernema glaseri TaxID=37863 RepID=A0A1I7YR11_9BILA